MSTTKTVANVQLSLSRVGEAYKKGRVWEEFEDLNLNELAQQFQTLLSSVDKQKATSFASYFH